LKPLKVIISGGGTGGHIFPAIAIANALKRKVPHAEILFVGALGRMEMEKVPAAGYKIIGIPIAGLQRRFTLSNLKLPFLIVKSLLKTRRIIREFQPHVAVGTGGYASGPLLRAAESAGIPVLLQEQNSYAGITNKLLSKKAARICVAYEGMEKYFPKEKLLITGNPVRQDLTGAREKKAEAMEFFNLDPGRKTILVIGGSLGARTINEAMGAGLKTLAQHDIQLIWQTGKVYYQAALRQAKDFQWKNMFVFDFIQRMDLAYAAADVVISRAGASSVSELCNMGLPSVLVPSPNVAEDHQTRNAMALVNRDAAVLVKDAEARRSLVDTAVALVNDTGAKERLSANIAAMAFHDAASRIADEVLTLSGYHP
jgi:UDP-N-acetylglucosamine--N-acetylmuramyl-(pentapeptide) pyrophosphoryl-undecaprenol N-acetylglucosamine transferase